MIETQSRVKRWERINLDGLEIYRRYANGIVVEEIESLHLVVGKQRILLVDDVLQTDNPKLPTGALHRYQYSNNVLSASLELNDQASVISYEEYHPYGTTAYRATNKDIEVPPKRYRYTGMERDEESGLSYHSRRYYASWLSGGFLRSSRIGRRPKRISIRSPVAITSNDTTGLQATLSTFPFVADGRYGWLHSLQDTQKNMLFRPTG